MLFKTARKAAVAVIGGTVLLIGVIMIVAPGPAFVFIPAGLAILATEFVWAARLLKKVKRSARSVAQRAGVLSPTGDKGDPRPPA